MTVDAVKNILDFAEGGAIRSLIISGEQVWFSDGKNQGTCEYSLNYNDSILQIRDQDNTVFVDVENINAIQMAL